MNNVNVALNFIRPDKAGAIMYEFDRGSSNLMFDPHDMLIADARQASSPFELERHGFELVKHKSAVTDFYDDAQVKAVYYPETEALVKRINGAHTVLVFGEAVRSEGPRARATRYPARNPHIDFDLETVRWWVGVLAGPERAAELLKQRFVLMNLWRPLAPVHRTPLAVCDASTVAARDLIPTGVGTTKDDPNPPPLFGYNVAYAPSQRWWWYPTQQADEVLAFKLADSDSARQQFTAHTAFEIPDTPDDAPARESIEIRTISFFGPEAGA